LIPPIQKKADDFPERGVVFTLVGGAFFDGQPRVFIRVEGQVGFGAADIACEEHARAWYENSRMWSANLQVNHAECLSGLFIIPALFINSSK
jgi:hypothetical protein